SRTRRRGSSFRRRVRRVANGEGPEGGSMADVEAGQGASVEVVAKWRTPLETTALILVAAIGFSAVGGIVDGVFTPGASAWRKLDILGFNVVNIWHVAVLAIAVGLVLALRIPFAPDARGASAA